jgi:hypothetical protein
MGGVTTVPSEQEPCFLVGIISMQRTEIESFMAMAAAAIERETAPSRNLEAQGQRALRAPTRNSIGPIGTV